MKRKFRIIFFALMFVNVGMLAPTAREITGTVIDGITGEPIAGIVVELMGVGPKAVSSADGSYSLNIPDSIKEPAFSGFALREVMEIKLTESGAFDIYLSEIDLADLPIEELMKIKVTTAGKKEQEITDVPGSIVMITRTDIERSGYKDIAEILENIPGYYPLGSAYFEGGSNFGIRGFSSGGAMSDFMIMVNGVSQIEDFSNSFSTDKIIVPVEAIERIEVVRGPNAVIYGSSAFLGVVNIITIQGLEKGINKILSLVGSNQTYKAMSHVSGENGDLKFVFNAAIRKTEGMDAAYSDMQTDTNIIKGWGLPANATTSQQFSGSQRYFGASSKYKGFSLMMTMADNDQGTPGSKPSANTVRGYALNTINNTVSGAYESSNLQNFKLKSRASFYNYIQNGDPHWAYAHSYNLFATKSKGFDLEATGLYTGSEQFDLLIGINNHTVLEASRFLDVSTSPSVAFRNFNYKLDENDALINNSVFAQSDLRVLKNLLFTVGVRIERTEPVYIQAYHDYTKNALTNADTTVFITLGRHSYDELQFIPRVASIYSFNKNNVLKFMFSQSNKRPSILENVNIGQQSLYGLNYAKMLTYEMDFTSAFAKNYLWSLNLFQNYLDDLVLRNVSISSTGAIATQAANAGSMETRGAELTLKLKPVEDFVFDLGLVYQNTENHTNGYPQEASYSPDMLAYLQVNYSIHRFSFNVSGNYVGAMRPGWNINIDPTKSAWYGMDVADYYKLNLNILAKNLWRGIYASLHVTNLLDTEIHFPTTANSTWTNRGLLGPGRAGQMELGYEF